MDKSWILKWRTSQEYIEGVKKFINFASANGAIVEGKLKCPCRIFSKKLFCFCCVFISHHLLSCSVRYSRKAVTIEDITCWVTDSKIQMDSTEASSSAGTSKKVRGRTRCIDLFKLPQGQKLKVCLNDMGQPTGENAAKLQNYCGILARDGQLLPLDCPSWRDIDENTKKHVLAAVQMKFDIEESGHQFILQSVSKKWRDFKCGIKRKYYDPEMAIPALYACHPEGVLHNQWRNLVQFWTAQESQKISDRNKINRSHQEMSHTSGTNSFANVRHEECQSSSPKQS